MRSAWKRSPRRPRCSGARSSAISPARTNCSLPSGPGSTRISGLRSRPRRSRTSSTGRARRSPSSTGTSLRSAPLSTPGPSRDAIGNDTGTTRQLFGCAAPALSSLPADRARTVEALAHLLYSASAWETLKDYGGLTGIEAGEAASWALQTILSAAGANETSTHPDQGDTQS